MEEALAVIIEIALQMEMAGYVKSGDKIWAGIDRCVRKIYSNMKSAYDIIRMLANWILCFT